MCGLSLAVLIYLACSISVSIYLPVWPGYDDNYHSGSYCLVDRQKLQNSDVLPDIWIDGVILVSPRDTRINRFSIYADPVSEITKSLLKQRRNHSIGVWSDVDQEISTTTGKYNIRS